MYNKRKIAIILSGICIINSASIHAENIKKIDRNDVYCGLNISEIAFNTQKIDDTHKNKETQYMGGVPYRYLHISQNYSKDLNMTPQYIIVHDTDNTGYRADAYAHYTYFNNNYVEASAHYFVDDKEVIQTVDDNLVAWHSGDRYAGVTPKVPDAKNSNSIGVEMCVNRDGNYEKTYENTIKVVKELMKRHNIPASNVIMHNDASGKYCSRRMLDNPELWKNFKKELEKSEGGNSNNQGNGSTNGNTNSVNNQGSGNYKEGVVSANNLNLRKGPDTNYEVIGTLTKGTKVSIVGSDGDFLKIESDSLAGYVHKDYVIQKNEVDGEDSTNEGDGSNSNNGGTGDNGNSGNYKKGIVSANNLNVRKGPSTDHEVIGVLTKDTRIKVIGSEGNFLKIEANNLVGYVHGDYVTLENEGISSSDNGNNSNSESSNTGDSTKYKDGIVSVDNLNFRKGPGTNYEVIGVLTNDIKVKVIQIKGDFLKIELEGIVGYAHKDYITLK